MELDHSLGAGLKYGGFIGYQANVSEEKHNLRAAVAFFGFSAGYDYKLLNNFSIGATAGDYAVVVAAYRYHVFNVTYHSKGQFTKGWNFSFDTGTEKCTDGCFGDTDYTNISSISVGRTF